MTNSYKKNAKLVLSNGFIFPRYSFGNSGTAVGEIVLILEWQVSGGYYWSKLSHNY